MSDGLDALRLEAMGVLTKQALEDRDRLEAENAELREHERQTHETLGAILGRGTSLEDGALRLKAENTRLEKALDTLCERVGTWGECMVPRWDRPPKNCDTDMCVSCVRRWALGELNQ
jgi:hypothetical protein